MGLAIQTGGALGKLNAFWTDDSNKGISMSFSKPLEKTLQGLDWVYDNGISQPISTFLLTGTTAEDKGIGEIFKGSTWSRSWHVAEHVSPGQAFWANHAEVRDIMENRPLYAAPGEAYLPPNWKDMSEDEQQELLRQNGMPQIGNRGVERIRRDQNWFTFASGATDFAFRWWSDPVVLGGKVAGAVRTSVVVKPRPAEGWSKGDIDGIMASSTMGKAQDFLWANKDNPSLINNLSMFQKSAMGPRAGGIISALRSPEEVNLFMRVSLGDVEARALLQERNAVAAQRLEQDTARLPELGLALPRVIAQGNPRAQAMIEERIKTLTEQVNANEDLVSRYGAVLAHYGELDAVNLTRWSFDRAQRRTAAQAAYRTGPALGTAGTPRGRLATARIYANDFFGPNLTVVRSFGEAHPNGLMAIDDIKPEAIDELRGHIARIPGIGPNIRQSMLDDYLKTTTEGERLAQLEKIQGLGVQKVAERHGLGADEAMTLYREYQASIVGGQEQLRRYSAGAFPGESIHLDEFMDGGGKLSVHPNLVTRLANDHVMIDLKALDTTLSRHSSALKALRTASLGNKDWLISSLDYFSHLWKFGTLFRLGYIPRVLGDDIAGQVARLGAATMAARAGYGVKNLATNLAHWKPARHYEAELAAAREGLKYIDDEVKLVKPKADLLRVKVETREMIHKDSLRRARDRHRRATNLLNALDETATPVQIAARQKLVERRAGEIARAEERLATRLVGARSKLGDFDDQIAGLTAHRDEILTHVERLEAASARGRRQSSQLHKEPEVAPGVVVPAAFAGERGEYFQKMISSDDSLRTLLAKNKQVVHSNLQKAYGRQGVAISYPQDPTKFVSSWHQAINNQLMQDALGVMAVKGRTVEEMAHWLKHTPDGRAYRKRLGIKYSTPDRIAASVWHEVQEYMPTWEIREAALAGKADHEFLTQAADRGHHPFNIHTTQLGESLAGSNHMSRGLDRVIDWWYKVAASIPADRMSRHPLFNQLYEGHAKSLASQELKQGAKVTQADADRIAETARRLALKDTRRLVFDIAHRSDAGHMLRFISPFFAATTEAWQRWARIIADRPQVVGYASIIYSAPAAAGWMQDRDGNKILSDGTAMVFNEKTGQMERKLVPKGERLVMARVPQFVVDGPVGKAFGMDGSGRWMISQDSVNIITQGDPFFNPGTGPIVAIPVNEFVKDKPKAGEIARHLGILPHGPTAGTPLFGNTPLGRAADLSMPQTVKNFLTSFDTSDERYQRVKLQIMQKAAYEHANMGKPMPSARQIADMTRQYWLESAAWSFVQPASTQRSDKYAFYRDQYNALRRKDPQKADEEFLARFGESYFIFAQATSKNVVGAEATRKAVELSQKYEEMLAANPELGALIIGPEGAGPFSPEAYTYQLTHPLVPGGSEMQRRKLSAEEAMKENSRREGWAKFIKLQNAVTAQLHGAGFTSFSDPGAEQFKAMRGAIATLLGNPMLPDGSENPYYNEDWSADFNSFDPGKYDRMIPGLTQVANSDMADDPNRSDLRQLRLYLKARTLVGQELAARKAAGGAGTLKAQANSDLADRWVRFVDGLREQDTRFGDLHSRYLSRDLGIDVEEQATLLGGEGA
ncbi:hypothetical protein ACFUJU_07950 [Streptomyces sp. NPDC057235]|uniref:hypothetical protein n=1 Tax=Streptomyces sp. NPDC057235 TaxID=3346058 RepID=UPI00362F13E6